MVSILTLNQVPYSSKCHYFREFHDSDHKNLDIMVGVAMCCASQLALWAYVHICTCIYSEHVNCQKQSAELIAPKDVSVSVYMW